jgi:hypothetical protein
MAAGGAEAKSSREVRDQPFSRRTKIVERLDTGLKQESPASHDHVYELPEKEIDEMLEAELYRPVILREGGKSYELPLIGAILRGLGNEALQGNRQAQQKIIELLDRFDVRLRAVQAKKASVKLDVSRLSDEEADTLERLLNKSSKSDLRIWVERPN